ncbi:MAG TPA: peptidylprolyl isomerase [Gemmatimonadaceae bacterium]|jgi:cyclophilin family peptidyl-prolyl cis-trans isomerase/HEAT repeat protein|nr:peptidylprolyl isomerase [Gemmatimonadaceae bacterium]
MRLASGRSIGIGLAVAVLGAPSVSAAQAGRVSRADSALLRRILSAEDRRDAADPALKEGAESGNVRVRVLARRAIGRIGDPRFAARDSLPPLPAPMTWPEPAWRLRYRALTAQSDCGAIRAALADSTWQVRLHAADLAGQACGSDTTVGGLLERWIALLPPDASQRVRGGVAWQAAAHAIVALARVEPADARRRLPALATHRQWQVRMYAARAAGVLADTASLRKLAGDANDNVKERAIDALSALTGHADDKIFLAVVNSPSAGAQAVRAAARALLGSSDPGAHAAENAAFLRWVARDNASARDARVALLAAAGRPANDDRPPTTRVDLPARAVALALGADARVRVTMARESGGGSFVVRMRGDVAPITAARILALVQTGYYNGYGWHRVEPDFVIQGPSHGDNEYVGYSRFFRDELGPVPHVRGTVGMSTRGHDTGDGQWFVNLRDNLRLGRDYTVFGEVVEGIDVVDGILEGDVVARIEEIR